MSKIIFYKASNKSIYKKLEKLENSNNELENSNDKLENSNDELENSNNELENRTLENETKIINKTEILSEKKSYLQLLNKIKISITNSNSNIKDISNSIIHIYDNYEAQLLCLHKLLIDTDFDEKKYFIQALKNKLDSYKQQDKKKTYDEYDNFITLENIIDKLVAYNMKCYYCNNKTLILFKNLRDDYQWTLDRINNYDEHSNANTIICCLKCNLQRRRKNSEKFKFTKQLEHKLLLLKKID